jgi:threonine/homoserine/homoserine lactone efflux protein
MVSVIVQRILSHLLALPSLQTAGKALGSACLLWLAWRIARSGPPNVGNGPARPVTN